MWDLGSLSRRVTQSGSPCLRLPSCCIDVYCPSAVLLKGDIRPGFSLSSPSPLSFTPLPNSTTLTSKWSVLLNTRLPSSLGNYGRMRTKADLSHPQGHCGWRVGKAKTAGGTVADLQFPREPKLLLKEKSRKARLLSDLLACRGSLECLGYGYRICCHRRCRFSKSRWSQTGDNNASILPRKSDFPFAPHAWPSSHPRTPSGLELKAKVCH